MHREQYDFSLNSLYKILGISKQSFHQWLNEQLQKQEEKAQMLVVIKQLREDHPCMSSRTMYKKLLPKTMGRDKFEAFCFENGFKVVQRNSFYKTTNSLGVTYFPNLIKDIELTRVNQVWVSDITYYRIGEKFYFITFIEDLYSRRIIGSNTSENLQTENTTLKALQIALKERKNNDLSNLIFHSDGGGQYYCKQFRKILKTKNIKSSMAENVYENANAERLNGIIKNDYLHHYNPQSYDQLKTMLIKSVKMYNFERPHMSIKSMPPAVFEKMDLELLTKLEVINKRKKFDKKEKEQHHNDIIYNFVNNNDNILKTVNPI